MDSNNNYKSNVDGFFDMLSSLIDVRYYDLISATAEKSGDPTFIKMVEAINVVAKKNGLTFKELFDIIMDLSILIQTEE